MRRRDFIALLGGAAAFGPLTARAQQSQPPLIGVLDAASPAFTARGHEAFRAGLRQLGYVEGRSIRFEYRYADGVLDRLPGLAEELVRLNAGTLSPSKRSRKLCKRSGQVMQKFSFERTR
jgi:hypothetical protein